MKRIRSLSNLRHQRTGGSGDCGPTGGPVNAGGEGRPRILSSELNRDHVPSAARLRGPGDMSDVGDMYRRLDALERKPDGPGLKQRSNYSLEGR